MVTREPLLDGSQFAEGLAKVVGLDQRSIEDAIAELLLHFGPDGHSDGNDVIGHFILKVLERDRKERLQRL